MALNRAEEAEQGFRRALEINATNAQAAANLGGLLFKLERYGEARGFLEMSLPGLEESQKSVALRLVQEIHAKQAACPQTRSLELSAYLRRFAGSQENSQSYFNTHLDRYLTTLEVLPSGSAGQRLLELGAAFHHLTPALVRWKGYRDIRCTDFWEGDAQCQRRVVSGDGQEGFLFTVDNFDVQRSPWPYPDGTFDVVLCCEMLEHLVYDPMQVLSEVNRILKERGRLLLTTPNIASAKGLESILRGDSPYVYGKYEPGGLATDRHNREYTPGEVARILHAAGFDVERLQTPNSWWTDKGSALRHLVAAGFSIASRGDNVFYLARKTGRVRDRYPAEFYLFDGTQFQRRTSTGAQTAEPEAQTSEPLPRPLKILIVHEVLPHPDQNGCDVRLLQILNELLAQGHELTYVAREGVDRERYALPFERMGIKTFAHDVEALRYIGIDAALDWSFEAVLKEGRFDLAILFHWFWSYISVPEHYLDEIRRVSPQTRIAVLSDDQHGLRERCLAELSSLWTDLEKARDFGQREHEVYRQADMVLAISEADRQGMLAINPGLEIQVLPMVAEGTPSGAEFGRRANVLFLGNFTNAANREGLDWLLDEVWPRVLCSLPEVQLHVAGHHLPENLADGRQGVVALGHVKDLDAVFAQHRMFVSPVRYCTGIQTKVMAAMARGLPVVTTPTAAEGLNLQHGKEVLVAASPESFTGEIVRAYSDQNLWQKLSESGAGAARRLGSEVARGKYLLLFNDDTIATPGLLAEHLRAQDEYALKKCAVLGDFRYPTEAGKRALTCLRAASIHAQLHHLEKAAEVLRAGLSRFPGLEKLRRCLMELESTPATSNSSVHRCTAQPAAETKSRLFASLRSAQNDMSILSPPFKPVILIPPFKVVILIPPFKVVVLIPPFKVVILSAAKNLLLNSLQNAKNLGDRSAARVNKDLASRADRVGEFGNGSVSWKEEPPAPGKALRMAPGSAAQDGNQK